MADHFTLDLDPAQLRQVATFLGEAEEHARTTGTKVAGTPDEIGSQWTGNAAVAIKGEMRALGGVMTGGKDSFSFGLGEAQQALTTLAGHFDTAQEDLVGINSRWSGAQTEYDDAPIGDHNPDGGGETAGERRDRKQGAASDDFEELKTWCRDRVRECGNVLATSSPIGYYGYQGSTMGYSTNVDALLPLLALTDQRHDLLKEQAESRRQGKEDAEELQQLLDDLEPYDSQEVRDLMASIAERANDPDYAEGFVEQGGSELLRDAYDKAAWDTELGTSYEDWIEPLQALNDVYAAGMEAVDSETLGTIVRDLGSAQYIGILTAITGSDYSGPRTSSAVLPYVHYLDDQTLGGYSFDFTRYLSQLANDEKSTSEIIAAHRADLLDPDELAKLLQGMDSESRERWTWELLSDRGNPYDDEIARNWNDILPGLLESARDQGLAGTLGALLGNLDLAQPPADSEFDLTAFLRDPRTLDVLTQRRELIDQEVIASLFKDHMGEEDMNALIRDMITRNAADGVGMDVTARNIGYLLGLADASDFSYDMGKVFDTAVKQARGELERLIETAAEGTKLASKLPYIKDAIAILEAFTAQSAEAAKKREDFGDAWDQEKIHENLAWLVYLQNNGAPESYREWLNDPAAQNAVPSDDPAASASLYLDWLEEHGDEEPYASTAEALRDLQTLIDETRDEE